MSSRISRPLFDNEPEAALLTIRERTPATVTRELRPQLRKITDLESSTFRLEGVGLIRRDVTIPGWTALLGERRDTYDVSIYDAPTRATDLSRIPPPFIERGSTKVFRDDDVAYATTLWAAGVQAHVWRGGFHGFPDLAPHATLPREAAESREAWIHRLLAES